nr:MAG TPA: hypothetical protein [Caudoviricetes sp.]
MRPPFQSFRPHCTMLIRGAFFCPPRPSLFPR